MLERPINSDLDLDFMLLFCAGERGYTGDHFDLTLKTLQRWTGNYFWCINNLNKGSDQNLICRLFLKWSLPNIKSTIAGDEVLVNVAPVGPYWFTQLTERCFDAWSWEHWRGEQNTALVRWEWFNFNRLVRTDPRLPSVWLLVNVGLKLGTGTLPF